eukprot:275080_1
MSSCYRCVTKQIWTCCKHVCKCTCHVNKNHNLSYIQRKNHSLWKTLTSTATTAFPNIHTISSSASLSSTTINLEHAINDEYDEYDIASNTRNNDKTLSNPSSNIKSFLDSFAITMKKSIKYSVTQQSLSLQNRWLRYELQSHDTYKFICNAQQALFEEILAEKIWYLYHFEHNKYIHGIPINILHKYLNEEYIKYGICTNDNLKTFQHRLLSLTKTHASYDDYIWLRMHQLPFGSTHTGNDSNITHDITSFGMKSVNKRKKQNNLHKITNEDIIGCNIDRTGRIAWYIQSNNNDNNLIFFPGVFEPDTIFISNALNTVNQLNKLLMESKTSHNTHILLKSSHLLENTKFGFFEQELWRFLTYYPSGGQYNTLINCYNLFGISSKDIMKQYLNKYIYIDN